MTMRVSEVYASAQGEGPNVGKTTVFLRFGGCNLRCPGWPCDTEHAINPAFRSEWEKHSVQELYERTFKVAQDAGAGIITLTGGEPFLQPKGDLEQLVQMLWNDGYEIECFSNGTILYPDWAPEFIHFIMDWKLPGSGEDPLNKTRFENLQALDGQSTVHNINPQNIFPQAVKFVINDHADLAAAHGLWIDHIKNQLSNLEVFYGRVWNSHLSDADLVKYVMDNGLPWRLNVQMHNYIWPANERGR